MGTPTTFVKLDRSITKWRWYQAPYTFQLFLHLILTANIEDHGFEDITVKRGQRVASYASLARETGMSVQNVRTAISHLTSTGELTKCSTPKYSVFTVVNYALYQDVPHGKQRSQQQTANKQVTNDQQQSKKVRTTYVEEWKNNIGGVAPGGAPAEPEDGDFDLWATS